MANNSFISTAQAKLALNAHTASFNSGTLKLYDGTQPANADVAVSTQNLLGTYTLGSTAFAAATGSAGSPAVAAANTITGANAVYSSSATWARAFSGATALQDFSVGTGGSDINLTSVVTTSTVALPTLTSLTITMPLKNGL